MMYVFTNLLMSYAQLWTPIIWNNDDDEFTNDYLVNTYLQIYISILTLQVLLFYYYTGVIDENDDPFYQSFWPEIE